MDTSQRERRAAKMDTVRRCRCLPIVCRSASSPWGGPSENSPGAPASTARRSGDGWPARAKSILESRHGSRCSSPSMSPIPGQGESISRFLMALCSPASRRIAERVLAANTANPADGAAGTEWVRHNSRTGGRARSRATSDSRSQACRSISSQERTVLTDWQRHAMASGRRWRSKPAFQ